MLKFIVELFATLEGLQVAKAGKPVHFKVIPIVDEFLS